MKKVKDIPKYQYTRDMMDDLGLEDVHVHQCPVWVSAIICKLHNAGWHLE